MNQAWRELQISKRRGEDKSASGPWTQAWAAGHRGPSEQPHVAGAMKAGEGDADGPVPTKKPVRVEWYDEFWELTYVSAAGEGNWGEQ